MHFLVLGHRAWYDRILFALLERADYKFDKASFLLKEDAEGDGVATRERSEAKNGVLSAVIDVLTFEINGSVSWNDGPSLARQMHVVNNYAGDV